MGSVTIVKAPLGEAPLWVREAWIGLHLPTHGGPRESTVFSGVLTGPRGFLQSIWHLMSGQTHRTRGFQVPSRKAIKLLAEVRPDAAEWWTTNAPQMLSHFAMFLFDDAACEQNQRH